MAKRSPNPIDKYVGTRVRMRRNMLRMSQGALAKASGITFQQVQKYEHGANRIGAGRLLQLADALQVSVLFFYEGAPSDNATKPPKKLDVLVTPEEIQQLLSSRDGLALVATCVRIQDSRLLRRIIDLVEEIVAGQKKT